MKIIVVTLSQLNNYDFHQQDKVREWWKIPREIPLFESYFVLENFPGANESKIKGISPRESSPKAELKYLAQMEYPLRVELFPLLELRVTMQYYRRCFTDAAIEVMLKDFHSLLLAVIANPYQRVGELRQDWIKMKKAGNDIDCHCQ